MLYSTDRLINKGSIFCFFFLAFLGLGVNIFAQTTSEQIIIDQFGFRTDAEKFVIFANPVDGQNKAVNYTPGSIFYVRRASDNAIVYSNNVVIWNSGNTHAQSGDKVWWGDFSAVTTAGEYYIHDPSNDYKSYNFEIKDSIYSEILKAAVKTYYYQRCGTNVSAAHGGNWNHADCHLGANQDANAQLYTNGAAQGNARDVHGGWHDAGDYQKTPHWERGVSASLNPVSVSV